MPQMPMPPASSANGGRLLGYRTHLKFPQSSGADDWLIVGRLEQNPKRFHASLGRAMA